MSNERFNKIVVGFDGSHGSRDAFALARQLAAPDAEIILLAAYPLADVADSIGGTDPTEIALPLRPLAEEDAAGDDRWALRVVADRSAARALHAAAAREDADLLVVGSANHGDPGVVGLGSVARQAVHGARCAVAIAPWHHRSRAGQTIERIAVGYNGTAEADSALAAARRTGPRAQLHVIAAVEATADVSRAWVLLPMVDEMENTERRMAENVLKGVEEAHEGPLTTEIVSASAARALELASGEANLVVIGTRGWGSDDRIVIGGTADRLLGVARCPVLIVPPSASVADRLPAAASKTVAS